MTILSETKTFLFLKYGTVHNMHCLYINNTSIFVGDELKAFKQLVKEHQQAELFNRLKV